MLDDETKYETASNVFSIHIHWAQEGGMVQVKDFLPEALAQETLSF